jgi:hypothetical protein
MSELSPRRRLVVELLVCTLLVLAYSIFALWRMDYLSADGAEHVRMTDNTRTAYVAKNIAEGRGYTTNELPAFLVDFYDQRGKLHQDSWPNADRFPFAAYVMAGMYLLTGSTSYEVGILGYNLIWFVAMLVMLYWLTRTVWNDRWAALAALAIAVIHPMTHLYLYAKDADMQVLTLGVMWTFYRYFRDGPDRWSWKHALVMGTVLGWLCLSRPNIGMGFCLCFAFVILRRVLALRREHGWRDAIAAVARREGIVIGVIALWCLPFVIHSMSEWGSPLFSANAMYQTPLGTRYAMNTDTWWKYSEPGASLPLATLLRTVPGELISKFPSSWAETTRLIVSSNALELILACGVIAVLARRTEAPPGDPAAPARDQAFLRVARAVGVVFLLNFLALPLYGYQSTGYRWYLSFYLPVIWVACGRAMVVIVQTVRPVVSDLFARIRTRPAVWLAVVVLAVFAINIGSKSLMASPLVAATPMFFYHHWLTVAIVIATVLFHRRLARMRWNRFGVIATAVAGFIVFRYQPNVDTKKANVVWFPIDDKVWDVLRQGKGLVMSLAMQGEVNWASDRKNIPAPEYVMHAYSLQFDHQLEVDDVYIESAGSLVLAPGAPFSVSAPGFESYVRLERFQGRLPGYEIVFHASGPKGYPKYHIKAREKASTIYRLVDPEAMRAMAQSPHRLELGRVDNVVYTAHGWGEYLTLDGKPLVAATSTTRERYLNDTPHRPWEDTSTTFFLDDRHPSSLDLEIYATHPCRLDFFWNLDLYAYDTPHDRPKHAIGSYEVKTVGWQVIHLEIPANVTRNGFNKLGFRTSSFKQVILCPTGVADASCASQRLEPIGSGVESDPYPLVFHDERSTSATPMFTSVLAGTLDLHYGNSATALPTPR